MPDVGDQYEDDDGQLWTITDEIRYLEVEIDEDPTTDEPYTTSTGQWPAESVADKVGDQLTPVNGGDLFDCPHCDYQAETEHGLSTHVGKVHGEDDDETTEE